MTVPFAKDHGAHVRVALRCPAPNGARGLDADEPLVEVMLHHRDSGRTCSVVVAAITRVVAIKRQLNPRRRHVNGELADALDIRCVVGEVVKARLYHIVTVGRKGFLPEPLRPKALKPRRWNLEDRCGTSFITLLFGYA